MLDPLLLEVNFRTAHDDVTCPKPMALYGKAPRKRAPSHNETGSAGDPVIMAETYPLLVSFERSV